MATRDLSGGPTRRFLVIGAVLALGAGTSACGRRGPLEPPPGSAQARKAAEQAEAKSDNPLGGAGGGTGQSRRRPPPLERPKRDFVLDPLL